MNKNQISKKIIKMGQPGKMFSMVFVSTLLVCQNLPAQTEVASVVSLDTLKEQALKKNPEILAAEADWIAAKKRIWVDSSLPDPMAGFDLMGSMAETRVGPVENRFSVSQEIPFPAKLYEKGKMAAAEARASEKKYEAVKRDILRELEKSYYDLYFTDSSLQALNEIKDLLKKFEGVAQSRYSNSSGTQRDVAKAQAEVSMSLEKIFILKQKRESAAAMINLLVNADPMTEIPRPVKPDMPSVQDSLVDLVNLAVTNRQEIGEREALVDKSRHAKRLAKLAYIPDLNVGFDYTWVGSGTTASDMDGRDQWMFPLRFTIPVWQNRIIPEIQEAAKRYAANESRLIQVKNQTFFEVKDAYYRFNAASQITNLYESAVIPQAQIALSADQAGYESGKADFLDLLDSERVYLNAKLNSIQFYTEALKAYADLTRATGMDLIQNGSDS